MKIKRLLVSVAIALSIGYGLNHGFSEYLDFQRIENGQKIEGTDYEYRLELVDIETDQPLPVDAPKSLEISILNSRTGARIPIYSPHRYSADDVHGSGNERVVKGWGRNLGITEGIAVIRTNNRIYFVTRAHTSGSGGFYRHHVITVENDQGIDQGGYLSCGTPSLNGNQLSFRYVEYQCPELFTVPLDLLGRLSWNERILTLE